MADNLAITPGAGATIRTDDVGGVHYQVIKLAYGADGSATLVGPSEAGLPVAAATKVLTGSTAANNTDVVNSDVSGYATAVVQMAHTSGVGISVEFQQSNDNSVWVGCYAYALNASGVPTSGPIQTASISGGIPGLILVPLYGRYFRIRVFAYTSGTVSATVQLSTVPSPHMRVGVTGTATVSGSVTIGGFSNAADGTSGTSTVLPMVGPMVYNGATWDRPRLPNVVKTVATAASGNTALWSPGASNRWRLQRVGFWVTANAAMASPGVLTIDLQDNTTSINVTQSVWLPGTAGTTMGSDWFSGWLDLGQGIRAAADNVALNVNLSAALTDGTVRVVACGVQGAGTAT